MSDKCKIYVWKNNTNNHCVTIVFKFSSGRLIGLLSDGSVELDSSFVGSCYHDKDKRFDLWEELP